MSARIQEALISCLSLNKGLVNGPSLSLSLSSSGKIIRKNSLWSVIGALVVIGDSRSKSLEKSFMV